MKLLKTDRGIVFEILVKPKAKQFQMKLVDDEIVVFCREAPVKGKVNKELVKELSRVFKKEVKILSGLNSRQKRIIIFDATEEEVAEILSLRSN